MLKEAQCDDDEARNLYQELLKANAEDYPAYRRLAAFFRDVEQSDESIDMINQLLNINMADTQAWLELAEMYSAKMNFQKASFCFEEVLVQQPSNYIYNLKYAEFLYSLGGGDNLILARKYFSKAVQLNNNTGNPAIQQSNRSTRAIFGLLETCTRLESMSKKYQDEVNQDLIEMCKEKLEKLYKGTKFDITKLS